MIKLQRFPLLACFACAACFGQFHPSMAQKSASSSLSTKQEVRKLTGVQSRNVLSTIGEMKIGFSKQKAGESKHVTMALRTIWSE